MKQAAYIFLHGYCVTCGFIVFLAAVAKIVGI